MNLINKIKSLPLSTKRLTGLSVVVILLIALPLFIWAVVTQKIFFDKKAAVDTTPLIIQESFEGNGGLDGSKWNWFSVVGASSTVESNKLKVTIPAGSWNLGTRTVGNDAVTQALVNYKIPSISGLFNVSVDIADIETLGSSASAGLKYANNAGIIIRRNKSVSNDKVEVLISPNNTYYDDKMASVELPSETESVKLRLTRTESDIKAYYNIGDDDILLATITDQRYLPDTSALPRIIVQNDSPDFPATIAYIDNYNATASMLVPTQACVAVNKIITVTNPSGPDDDSGCHDIQLAIDAVDGEGYTILIGQGDYNITKTIYITNKHNLKIEGNVEGSPDEVWLSFNTSGVDAGGYGIKVENSSGSIQRLHAEGITPNGLLSIQGSTNFSVRNTYLFGTSSHTFDAQNSGFISISDSEIKSSAGGLDFNNISDGIQIFNLKITNTDNGIAIYNSSNINLDKSLIINNRESAITMQNVHNMSIDQNTIVNNATGNNLSPAIYIYGSLTGLSAIKNNLIVSNQGVGIKKDNQSIISDFRNNDIWANDGGNYVGLTDPTGTNGNISVDPLLETTNGYYCLLANSPALYGVVNNHEYMGKNGPCTTSTPTPAPNICTDPFIIDIVPQSQSGVPGQTVRYNVNITNNKTSCGSYTTHLIIDKPSNWQASFGTGTFELPQNQVFSTYLDVTSSLEDYVLGENPLPFRISTEEYGYMGTTQLIYNLVLPLPGDVNSDGHVNLIDIGILVDNYRSSPPSDLRADLNNDNVVNIVDIGIVIDNYEF